MLAAPRQVMPRVMPVLLCSALCGCSSPPPPAVGELLESESGAVLWLPCPGAAGGADAPPEWLLTRPGGVLSCGEGAAIAYLDPLLVLGLHAAQPGVDWAVPPRTPGAVLPHAQVRWVVVDRNALGDLGEALLDPVLRRTLGPPVRDHHAQLDVYRLGDAQGPSPEAARLIPASAATAGWSDLSTWLKHRRI